MNTFIEFLDDEPMENVAACLKYRADRVLFFGYDDVIKARKSSTEQFLTKRCGVQKVFFFPLSQKSLPSVLQTMRTRIGEELKLGSSIFIDITGGESMILAAIGILSHELKLPMFEIDIARDRVIEMDTGSDRLLSRDVPRNEILFDIDLYIEMRGGAVNYSMHKDLKALNDPEFTADVRAIWKVADVYRDCWTSFTELLKSCLTPDENLRVSRRTTSVLDTLSETPSSSLTPLKTEQMIRGFEEAGILKDVELTAERYRFTFKNAAVKDCIWESGAILELHTYLEEMKRSDDCLVGVHLDWDGILHSRTSEDVLNEIDVLSVKGDLITFISCKAGRLGSSQSLYALYELETVAERFGGKYARKKLVTFQPLNDIYMERAAEMGIEVVVA